MSQQTISILAVCFLAVATVVAVAFSGSNATQVIGFAVLICAQLIQLIGTVRSIKTVDSIHGLVNSNMGIQLKVSSIAIRRIAELTKDPVDSEAAIFAEKQYEDHMKRQKIVDQP